MKNGLVIIGSIVLIILAFTPWASAETKEGTLYFSPLRMATDRDNISANGSLMFIFIILPGILLILKFLGKSNTILGVLSGGGGLGVLIWVIGFGDTFSTIEIPCWISLGIYVVLTIVCILQRNNETGYQQKGNYLSNKKCRQCGTIYSSSFSSCPKCNFSLYEETNQSIDVTISQNPPISVNYGDTWTCKKCNEKNPNTAPTCKGCGGYK